MFALGTLFDTCYKVTHIIIVNHLTLKKACSMYKFLVPVSQKEQTVTTAGRHSPSSLLSSLTLPAEVQGKLSAADAVPGCAPAEAVLQAHSLLWENWGELNIR